jgi:hypothetical protein
MRRSPTWSGAADVPAAGLHRVSRTPRPAGHGKTELEWFDPRGSRHPHVTSGGRGAQGKTAPKCRYNSMFLKNLRRLISFQFELREAFAPLFDIDIHVEVERLWNVVAGSGENAFCRAESGFLARIGVAAECEQSGHRVSPFSTVFPVAAGLPPSPTRIDSRFPQAVRTPGSAADASTSRRIPRRRDRIRNDGLWPDENGGSGALTKKTDAVP